MTVDKKVKAMNPILNFVVVEKPSCSLVVDPGVLVSALTDLVATKALSFPKGSWSSYYTTLCNVECKKRELPGIRTVTRGNTTYVWMKGVK